MKKTVDRIIALIALVMLLFTAVFTASAEGASKIQAAISAANALSAHMAALPDGTLVALSGSAEYIDFFRTLGKIKRIEYLQGDKPAVLTEGGDLYVGDRLVAQNIADMAYPATSSSGSAMFIDRNNAFAEFRYSSSDLAIWPRQDADWAKFVRMDTEEFEKIYFAGTPSNLICDDMTFWVLDENGYPYCDGDRQGELVRDGMTLSQYMKDYENVMGKFMTLELHTWSDLEVFAFASEYDRELGVNFYSYAGVKGDGTVVACGKLAEEILTWGPLSYVDGKMGCMLGVTQDGEIRLAGRYAQPWVLEELQSWKNIVSAKIISCLNTSDDIGIVAIDESGVIYRLFSESGTIYDGRTSYEIGVSTYSPENGYEGESVSKDNLRELGLII